MVKPKLEDLENYQLVNLLLTIAGEEELRAYESGDFTSEARHNNTASIIREAVSRFNGCPCPFDCDGCHDGDGICWRGNAHDPDWIDPDVD